MGFTKGFAVLIDVALLLSIAFSEDPQKTAYPPSLDEPQL